MSAPARRAVVVGLGSEYRSDDAVGVVVARRVAAASPPTVDVGPIGEPLELLNRWDEAAIAVVVDATRSGSQPGTMQLLDLAQPGVGARVDSSAGWSSTHGLNVADVYRLAHALGQAPERVIVVGIEGERFGDGYGLSASVEEAIGPATELVLELIDEAL